MAQRTFTQQFTLNSESLLFTVAFILILVPNISSFSGYLETYPKVQASNGTTTPLYFGLIMSFPGGEFDSSGAIAGVRVALDRINSDPTLLPNYTLHYTLTNSSVSYHIYLRNKSMMCMYELDLVCIIPKQRSNVVI